MALKKFKVESHKASLAPVAAQISDHTATIKVNRFLKEMKKSHQTNDFFNPELFVDFHKKFSVTRVWKDSMSVPKRNKNVITVYLNKKMETSVFCPEEGLTKIGDPKQTAWVGHFSLVHANKDDIYGGRGFEGLLLARMIYSREFIRKGIASDGQLILDSPLKVTFHSLQRLVQRGHCMADNGQITYRKLLVTLYKLYHQMLFQNRSRDEDGLMQFRFVEGGLRHVISVDKYMYGTLVTVLPGKDNHSGPARTLKQIMDDQQEHELMEESVDLVELKKEMREDRMRPTLLRNAIGKSYLTDNNEHLDSKISRRLIPPTEFSGHAVFSHRL